MADTVWEEPMRTFMITLSAWRRLWSKALEMKADESSATAGAYILFMMSECYDAAFKDMEKQDKELAKEIKKEGKK